MVSNSAIEGCLALLISGAWCWSTVEHLMKGSFVWCEYVSKKTLLGLCQYHGRTQSERRGKSGQTGKGRTPVHKEVFSLFALEKAVACFLLFAYYLGGRLV